MSLMLLVGAGLLVQSMMRLQHQRLGIRQDHLLPDLDPAGTRGRDARIDDARQRSDPGGERVAESCDCDCAGIRISNRRQIEMRGRDDEHIAHPLTGGSGPAAAALLVPAKQRMDADAEHCAPSDHASR